jgi:hypothetical protein
VTGLAIGVALTLLATVGLDLSGSGFSRHLDSAIHSIDPLAGRPAPPKSREAPPPGFLVVAGLPTGAVVTLDGRRVAPGPDGSVEAAAGSHRVEVRTTEGAAWVGRAEVPTGGKTQIRAMLEGEAVFEAGPEMPRQAVLVVDGADHGPLPVMVEGLAAGWHRALLRSGERIVWEEEFQIAAGATKHVVIEKGRETGPADLSVTARLLSDGGFLDRAGSEVRLDGRPIGQTPWSGAIEPGVHSIRVTDATGAVWTGIVTVPAGSKRQVSADFDGTEPARVTLKPAGAPLPGQPWAVTALLETAEAPERLEATLCVPRPSGETIRVLMAPSPERPDMRVGVVPAGLCARGTVLRCYVEASAGARVAVSEILEITI